MTENVTLALDESLRSLDALHLAAALLLPSDGFASPLRLSLAFRTSRALDEACTPACAGSCLLPGRVPSIRALAAARMQQIVRPLSPGGFVARRV